MNQVVLPNRNLALPSRSSCRVWMHNSLRMLKRIMICLVGGIVLLAGVALIILPGPAVVVIPAGLAILGLEFAWARHCLHKLRDLWPRKKFAGGTEPTSNKVP